MACGGEQIPVVCSLCEEDFKIKWKCLNCDMLMCDKCKEKIHVKFKFAKDHKVFSIQEVGLHDVEIDFSNISCTNHLKQICFMFCKSCDCLVCPLCISKTHNGHGLVTIREGYEIQIDNLKTGQKNISTNIEELKKNKAEVEVFDRSEHSKLENTMKKIEGQKTVLMIEVNKHIDELKSELMDRWEALHLSTKNEEKEVALLIGNLESQKTEVEDIMQSNDAKKIFVDGLGLVKSIKEKVSTSCTKFNSIPTFLPGQVTSFNIGSLENVSMKGEIRIIKQFDTGIEHVQYMTAYSDNTLWIADHNILQKIKVEGRSLKIIIGKSDIKIFGLALTPSKDLLVVAGGSTLKQISDLTGEKTDSKYNVKGFALSAVHVNTDGKVTVGGYNGKIVYPAVGSRRVVIIIMDRNGNHESTYEYDAHGNPIFTNIKSITRTMNGNICVVDKLYEDNRGRVMILSENGDVLNIFRGHSEVNTDKIPFLPSNIFTTQSDRIVVSSLTHNIYFLNSAGNYIGWCATSKVGILYPRAFCSTEAGHIYVGCVTPPDSSSKAKMYQMSLPI